MSIHVFFVYAYKFCRSGWDMPSQNFQVNSNYACDMLIFAYISKNIFY